MPSLHTAVSTLVALYGITRLRHPARWLLLAYPALMSVTLVYTGEHYVLDLVAGLGYALAVHFALNRWEARRADRRLEPQVRAPADDLDERERAALT